jgi:formiminoglutamase
MKNNKRYLESLSPHFEMELKTETKSLFLLASNDEGVMRNKGRNGSRYAPEAILNNLKKMNNHIDNALPAYVHEVFPNSEDAFEEKQNLSAKEIYNTIKEHMNKNIVHLGGGHDHAYPFLKALESNSKIKNILILNIDAHCDTRIDTIHHSGTPFRNFTDETKKNVFLIQYGIHNYANSTSTLTPIKNGKENHYSVFKARENSKGFGKLDKSLFEHLPFKLGEETFIYLSLDCDAIESSTMEAVSAVNHEGIPLSYLQLIINKVKSLSGPKAFGVYEYNPIYDNLSQKGSRALCSLIYNWLS